ncbi:MAG: cyclic pyranopterin monophosphate synthase MoaC [Myxococcales bacterium]|nr:cyclic pyranopterin monophosphate synthase MoaC [Myxococcales bacterium]
MAESIEIPQESRESLTHLSATGEARMVDVRDKPVTARMAIAEARVRLTRETARLVSERSGPKGDVVAAARIAGIMAAKRTAELIPMCHPLALSRVVVDIRVAADEGLIFIEARAEAHDRTGVEMEAMTAASVAALTIYDMLKSVERGLVIESVMLLEKCGGRSGHYRRGPREEAK